MLGLIYDSETTGLDPAIDRVVQHAAQVVDVATMRVIDSRSWLAWDRSFPSITSSEKVHGWNLPTLMRFGRDPVACLVELSRFAAYYSVEFIVAHNGIKFDRNFVAAELKRVTEIPDLLLTALPWLDTKHHAAWSGCPSKHLITIAAHNNFLNPFPHDALSDCFTLAKLLHLHPSLIEEMISSAARSRAIVFANIPPKFDRAMNEKVKLQGFKWQEIDGHRYDNCCIRIVWADEVDKLTEACQPDFQVSLIKEIHADDAYLKLQHKFQLEGK